MMVLIKGYIPKKNNLLILLCAILIGIAAIWINSAWDPNSYKWDSAIYVSWVKDFPAILNNHINAYHIQKIFPSIAVNIFMRTFKVPVSTENILFSFQIYNFLITIFTIYFWLLISNTFKLNFWAKASLSFLFVASINSTNWISLPAIIDPTALFIFSIILWAYFTNKSWCIYATIIPATFTWPSLIYFSFFLIAFPYNEKGKINAFALKVAHSILPVFKWVAIFASLIVLLFTIYQLNNQRYIDWCSPADFSIYTPFYSGLLYLSILCNGLFVYFSFKPIFKNITIDWLGDFFCRLFSIKLLIRVSIFAAFFFGMQNLIDFIASDEQVVVSGKRIISSTFILPLIFPFSNILAHLIWYGPLIVLIVFNYTDIIRNIFDNKNHGLILTVAMSLIFAINPESRYSFNLVLVFLFYLASIRITKLNTKQILFICILQLLHLILYKLLYDVTYDSSHRLNGPWVSHQNYIIAIGLFTLYSAAYFLFTRNLSFRKYCSKKLHQ
jgi:hypothetical protein